MTTFIFYSHSKGLTSKRMLESLFCKKTKLSDKGKGVPLGNFPSVVKKRVDKRRWELKKQDRFPGGALFLWSPLLPRFLPYQWRIFFPLFPYQRQVPRLSSSSSIFPLRSLDIPWWFLNNQLLFTFPQSDAWQQMKSYPDKPPFWTKKPFQPHPDPSTKPLPAEIMAGLKINVFFLKVACLTVINTELVPGSRRKERIQWTTTNNYSSSIITTLRG